MTAYFEMPLTKTLCNSVEYSVSLCGFPKSDTEHRKLFVNFVPYLVNFVVQFPSRKPVLLSLFKRLWGNAPGTGLGSKRALKGRSNRQPSVDS